MPIRPETRRPGNPGLDDAGPDDSRPRLTYIAPFAGPHRRPLPERTTPDPPERPSIPRLASGPCLRRRKPSPHRHRPEKRHGNCFRSGAIRRFHHASSHPSALRRTAVRLSRRIRASLARIPGAEGMTTRDSSTAATLAFQADIASAKARRDRDLPRHSTLPPVASTTAPAPSAGKPVSSTPDIDEKSGLTACTPTSSKNPPSTRITLPRPSRRRPISEPIGSV